MADSLMGKVIHFVKHYIEKMIGESISRDAKPWYKKIEVWIPALSAAAAIISAFVAVQSAHRAEVIERPYVSIEPWGGLENSSVVFRDDGVILLLFRLTNNGRTPANRLVMQSGKISATDIRTGQEIQWDSYATGTVPVALASEGIVRVGVGVKPPVEGLDFETLKIRFNQGQIFFTANIDVSYEGMTDQLLKKADTAFSTQLFARDYEILQNFMD